MHREKCGPPTEELTFHGVGNIPLISLFFQTLQGNYCRFELVWSKEMAQIYFQTKSEYETRLTSFHFIFYIIIFINFPNFKKCWFILFYFILCILIASVCPQPDSEWIQIWNIVMQSEKWGPIQINTSANILPNSLLPNSISPQSHGLQGDIVVWRELRSICRCVTVYYCPGIETCIVML